MPRQTVLKSYCPEEQQITAVNTDRKLSLYRQYVLSSELMEKRIFGCLFRSSPLPQGCDASVTL